MEVATDMEEETDMEEGGAVAEVAIAVITIVIGGVHLNEMTVLGPEITTIAVAEEEEVIVVAAEVEVEGAMAAAGEEEVRSIR